MPVMRLLYRIAGLKVVDQGLEGLIGIRVILEWGWAFVLISQQIFGSLENLFLVD